MLFIMGVDSMRNFLQLIRENRLIRINFILISGALCASVLISMLTLHRVTVQDREQSTRALFQGLYTAINTELEFPATVTKTMSYDSFLADLLQQETSMDAREFEIKIKDYLSNIQQAHGWETVCFASEATRRYYTNDGYVKTIDPTTDPYDIWYDNFIDTGLAYGADMSYDQFNEDNPTIYVDRRMEIDGQLYGIIVCAIDTQTVSDMLQRYTDEYSVDIYFTDVEGNITLSKDGCGNLQSYLDKAYNNNPSERNEEYQRGKYIIRQYIPLLGMYLVVENTKHFLSSQVFVLLFSNLLCIFLFVIIITFFNHNYFMNEKSELKRKVRTDYLTKILNVSGLEHNIVAFLESEDSTHIGGTMFIMDIDHFKDINDTFGHSKGDEVLAEFAHKLTKFFRGGDTIGRLGGDEFMVFSPTMQDLTYIKKKAADLAATMRDEVVGEGTDPIEYTISVGFARFPQDGSTYQELYKQADAGLYYVKEHGRNNLCYCKDIPN